MPLLVLRCVGGRWCMSTCVHASLGFKLLSGYLYCSLTKFICTHIVCKYALVGVLCLATLVPRGWASGTVWHTHTHLMCTHTCAHARTHTLYTSFTCQAHHIAWHVFMPVEPCSDRFRLVITLGRWLRFTVTAMARVHCNVSYLMGFTHAGSRHQSVYTVPCSVMSVANQHQLMTPCTCILRLH